MSFIKNRQVRLPENTKTSLLDVIEIEGDLYIVTNLEPLELTAIEHYGGQEEGDNE